MDVPAQEERTSLTFLYAFVLFRTLKGLGSASPLSFRSVVVIMFTTHAGKGEFPLLFLLIQMIFTSMIFTSRSILTDRHDRNVLAAI